MNPGLIGSIEKIQENTGEFPNFTFIQDYSYNVVKGWDKPFDYIFIDASHEYDDVLKDFTDWYPLLSVGGYLSFHDSTKHYGGPFHWDGPSDLVRDILEGKINQPSIEFFHMVHCLTIFRKV